MAGPPRGLLALVLLLAVSEVLSDDGLPKWSQRSSRSTGGWIPIEAPCLTCRPAAEAAADMEVQASSDFASAPLKAPPAAIVKDTEYLRPPPAPVRVQRQEASRPILDSYIENQRPPPPPIAQPTGGKQGRDHRFLYSQNPPRQQFQGFPLENQHQQIQHPRVVFPTHQTPGTTQGLIQNIQPSRQPTTFLNQQFQHPAQSLQQQSLHQQPLRPQKQIRLPGISHDQFPLILPPTGLGPPHGFQSPQLQLLPVPHAPQPTTAQVNLQNIFQQQLQNQLHHQINQQLLGSPLTSSFPPSAIGQQLDFHTRNNPLAPVNVQLVPQQQQVLQPVKTSPPPPQKLETTSPPKPSVIPIKTFQADDSRKSPQKEKQVSTFQANPEEDVEEEVQLLYVPVEALRQRDRVNKQVLQNTAAVRQQQKYTPERQVAHSFEIKHFPNAEIKQISSPNLGVIHGNTGTQVTNIDGGRLEVDNIKANQGQETIVREEKLLSFTPPRVQQFHENGAFQQQTQTLLPTRQFAQQNQEKFRFQNGEQLQQQEQQSALRHQSQKPQRPLNQQFQRQPSVAQEENSQRFYQDSRQESGHTFPPQTTSRPIPTSPSPTYTTTQSLPTTSPAPYQPPLSVYMEDIEGQDPSKLSVDDVLRSLNGAKTVPVLERAGPNPPKVFVGPSVLRPPNGYAKFELPYLSMLDSNRVERKVDRLPFFVAPLSFQPPSGYAKIPFPAPHIGSVVVSSGPVASTTERGFPVQQNVQPSALPELVNSLQASNASPPGVEYTPTIASVVPFPSTQRPRPLYNQNQPNYQQFTPQQPIYHQQGNIYQQQQQQRVENEHKQAALINQQLIHQPNPEEVIPQQQPLPLSEPHSFTYHSTPIPSEEPIYYSPTPSTTPSTTTSTTTALPQTRAPAHHSRGRTRQRPSYTQSTSSDSDNNYRNRGSYRGNSDATRQPSTRTRRPWDGRRRPTTTPEPIASPETYSFDGANQNFSPVQPLNDITPSTTSTTDSTRDAYLGQNVREPSLAQQQYTNDDIFSPAGQSSVNTNEDHLRNQGAVVLSAFQQPQVLGDVITGQIQKPDDNTGFRTYYGGQREYTVSTFEPSPSLSVSPTLPQVPSPTPITDQKSSVYKGAFDGELKNKDQPRQPLKNKDSERGTSFSGQKSEIYSNYQQPRGQKYFSQQNFRETEAPAAQVQQSYPEGLASITQVPYVEQQFVIPSGQRVQAGDSGRFRNYHNRPNSLKDQRQGPNVFPTEFTPSVEITDAPSIQKSPPVSDNSGLNGNQQPQYFIISTPIPNPLHGINRTYGNEQIFEIQQPLIYTPVKQSPHADNENGPITVLISEDLLSKEQSPQDSLGNNYKLPDVSPEQIVEENPSQLPKTTTPTTTTTQDPAFNIQTQEEPKRTRYRVPQRTYSGSSSQNAPESSDAAIEERPRYRGHQSRYNGETRTRQPGQRTRGRHYTTESPTDEEAPAAPQRTHHRYRGRHRVSSSTLRNSQSSDSYRNPVSQSPAATEKTLSEVQSESGGETSGTESNTQDVSQIVQTEEQFRKPEKYRSPQSQISQEQDTERPVHNRGRSRLRGGDRAAGRQRPQYGSYNNQESPSPGNNYSRNPTVGQRYQHTPRRNPVQELVYQEPQRDNPEDSQQVTLAFDSPSQNTPLILKAKDETSYSPNPIVIESFEAKDQKGTVGIIQGVGDFIAPEVPINQALLNEQYEQPSLSIDAGSDYQEAPTTPAVPSTTELITTTTAATKPGRKYGNFVSRVGSPRRQSHVTAPLNSLPSTTPPPENNQPNKVYTVRPTRRPVVKPATNTRIRIRRPTTPTSTTTTPTTESSYYLTTSPPINAQQESPSYDTSSFGNTRGGFRVRKRPVAGSRRPTSPSSNEVNQDEQEEEPARHQGGYRQRPRVPSRRLPPSTTERTAPRWRQTDYPVAEEQQEPGTISQSAQGFKVGKTPVNADSYVEQQNGDDSSKFQISLSEEQLASHIPTKALRTHGTFNQSPVYQSGEQYYTQESHQPQEGQDNPLKYHNPPVRPSSFAVPDDTAYTYERSRPFSTQPNAQTYDNSPDGAQQKGTYQSNQQDFVINFSGANRGEDSLYPNKDELESGEESRYFDKVKSSKSNGKPYSEKENFKDEVSQEASIVEDVQPEREPTDDSQGHSTTFEAKAVTLQPEESASAENKESAAKEEPTERVESRPLKKVAGGRRRGNWVRVRTKTHRPRPGDTLETAESQNLASVSQNVLQFTTPLKEKTAPSWLNTPVPEDVVEDKQPDAEEEPAHEDAEASHEATEPSVENYSDLDLSDVDEEPKEDEGKSESDEDIFEDLENGDFTPTEKESLEADYDSKEKTPPVPKETEEILSEGIDSDTEESGKNASQNSREEKTEEVAEETFDAHGEEDKVADVESSTEQPEDDYDQQQETLPEKTEESTEEAGESTTDQPTPRVLGTSTTTEISLETEICYRGRCVKTKVDADQVPIE